MNSLQHRLTRTIRIRAAREVVFGYPSGVEVRGEVLEVTAPECDQHIQGWRFQLPVFADVLLNGIHEAGATALVDAWHTTWAMTDEAARAVELQRITTPGVELHDRYSTLCGYEDLTAHTKASQRFMQGNNTYSLAADGRIERVVGFAG